MANEPTYTIRAGDTLGAIALRFGTTVEALARLNAIADPGRIRAGQCLRTGIGAAPELGALSRKYEVGNRGPGTVSGGNGDAGGVSYGSYQLASRFGNPERFLAAEGKRWCAAFAGARSGTASFTRAWQAVARREPDAFAAAQHAFVRRTHFDPQVARIEQISGIDVTRCSRALQDAVWSAAVQHGPNADLVGKALQGLGLGPGAPGFDRAAIAAIYRERGRRDARGTLVHFARSSPVVQRALARRFEAEERDALAMLEEEASRG